MEYLVLAGVVIGIAIITVIDRRRQRRADAFRVFHEDLKSRYNPNGCQTYRSQCAKPNISQPGQFESQAAPPTVIRPDLPCCDTFGD